MWLTLLLACGTQTSTPEPEPTVTPAPVPKTPVEVALGIARAIDADPAAADKVLADAGVTEADYRKMLRDIAHDPVQAAAFAEGR